MSDFRVEMDELESAEEFLDFFGILYDEEIVRVNRLHILQRFHDYLAEIASLRDTLTRAQYAALLRRSYQDFVRSDARTERVFKVFRQHQAQVAFVPLASLGRRSA